MLILSWGLLSHTVPDLCNGELDSLTLHPELHIQLSQSGFPVGEQNYCLGLVFFDGPEPTFLLKTRLKGISFSRGLPITFSVTKQQDQLVRHSTSPSAFALVHNSY